MGPGDCVTGLIKKIKIKKNQKKNQKKIEKKN